jgi:uncharacterized protein YdaU (DUF1376 family)
MAAKADTWMPLYIADYLRKTMHLTRDQHGGYMLLLMACWDRGGRLPNDPGQLAGIARATPAEWRKLSPVLLPFFEIDGADLIQGRVIEEHEKASRLSEARRAAGSQGGRPKKQGGTETVSKPDSEQKPIGFQNRSQTETHTRVALPSPSTAPPEHSVSNETGAKPPGEPHDSLADLRALPIAKGAWDLSLKVLMGRGGYSEGRARPIVGKWVKDLAEDHDQLWRIAEAAWTAGTLDPVSYVAAAIQRLAAQKVVGTGILAPSPERQRAWMEDFRDHPTWWKPGDRGPAPGEPGCRIAVEIQREFGFEPAEVFA